MISYITYQQLICYNTSSILLIIKISDVFTNFLIAKEVKYQIILLSQLRHKVQNIVKSLSKQPIYRYFLNCSTSSQFTFYSIVKSDICSYLRIFLRLIHKYELQVVKSSVHGYHRSHDNRYEEDNDARKHQHYHRLKCRHQCLCSHLYLFIIVVGKLT